MIGENNNLSAEFGFIGAGSANTLAAAATYGAIAGGNVNNLSGEYGFIGGGSGNHVSAEYGAAAGGLDNYVTGEGGYIAAGGYNTAGGEGAVVDGGFNKHGVRDVRDHPRRLRQLRRRHVQLRRRCARQRGADRHLRVERRLRRRRDPHFGTRVSVSRARFGRCNVLDERREHCGCDARAGSGTWASASDRNAQDERRAAGRRGGARQGRGAADQPLELQVRARRASRRTDGTGLLRRVHVGEDDKHITSIDEDGVALAAIKALHARVGELRARTPGLRP